MVPKLIATPLVPVPSSAPAHHFQLHMFDPLYTPPQPRPGAISHYSTLKIMSNTILRYRVVRNLKKSRSKQHIFVRKWALIIYRDYIIQYIMYIESLSSLASCSGVTSLCDLELDF